MPLVKLNNLLKYNNNLVKLQTSPAFVKLSYFNNYANSTDTPVYGDPYTITNNGNLIKNTMVINGITYPSLKLYGAGYSGRFNSGLDFLEVKTISIDFYVRINVQGCWTTIPSYCNTRWSIPGLWGNFYSSNRGIGSVSTPTSNRPYYANPKLRSITFDNQLLYVNDTIKSNTIFHAAYVYTFIDDNTVEERTYINGELQVIYHFSKNLITNNNIVFDTNYTSNCYVEFTQMAIRIGDYSINDGLTFPVPTEPYAQW